nr:tail fiber domain-containing protein [Chitinophagaceae bacterium]
EDGIIIENTSNLGTSIPNAVYFKSGDFFIGGIKSFRTTNSNNRLSFFTGFDANRASLGEKLTIRENGMVGIGITQPATRLHIVDAGANPTLLTLENQSALNTGVANRLVFETGNRITGEIFTSGTDAFSAKMGFVTYGGDASGTAGGVRMVISENGLVGIGNPNPTRGGLVVDRKIGAVNAMFGSLTTGVAIESSFPGVGFNTYFDGSRKFIANGFGGLVGLNPSNGDFYILSSSASGTGGNTASTLTRLLITSAGNVGINTTTPQERLTVKGNGTGIAQESSNGLVKVALRADDAGGTWVGAISNSDLRIIAGLGVNAIFAKGGTGLVGVGTTTPAVQLQVGNSGDGTVARANAWQIFSDERYKKGIVPIANALEKIEQLSGYYYYWKDGADKQRQAGLLAQEVEKVLPEIVDTDSQGYKSVDYGKMNALLLQALKEQGSRLAALEEEMKQYRLQSKPPAQ